MISKTLNFSGRPRGKHGLSL